MIFVSHKKDDMENAHKVRVHLEGKGIKCWIDDLDKVNIETAQDITRYIIDQLNQCSHIIAIYSINTTKSRWVPFELGAAYQGSKGIGTYIFGTPEIPAYLKPFPIMRRAPDLDQFADMYKQEQRLNESKYGKTAALASVPSAQKFIEELKRRIGNP